MKRSVPIIMAILFVVSLLTITSVQAFEIVTRDMVEKETITITDLIKTADNFIILFDTSSSTNEMVPGRSISKIQAAKNLLKERNAWLPELGYKAGIYVYTNRFKKLDPILPMQVYDRDDFAAAIDRLPDEGSGPTLMQWGLTGLKDILAGLSGKTAIIMFSDGKFSESVNTKRPRQIARELASRHDICFYLISSASEERNLKMMEAVSQINACSRVVTLATFLDNPQYLSGALFTVKTSSYTRLKPMSQTVGVFVDDILFDYDSSVLRSEYQSKLDDLGDYLVKNPDAFVVVGGFTDSRGDDEYNMWLSKRRALSIKNYLLSTYTIDEDRVVLQWFGEQNPAADNATEEGRQRNRRVELAVGM